MSTNENLELQSKQWCSLQSLMKSNRTTTSRNYKAMVIEPLNLEKLVFRIYTHSHFGLYPSEISYKMTNYNGIMDIEVIIMVENKELKFDGYIKISSKKKDENITEISNIIESTNNLNKKADVVIGKAAQPLIDENKNISQLYINQIIQGEDLFTSVIEPLTELSKKIIEMCNPIIKSISENITKIFEKIDFTAFDFIYKEIAIKYLSNGFYPYKNTNVEFEKLVDTKNKIKQTKIIKDGVKLDIKSHKKVLLSFYPCYKKEINEIYRLYKERNYRLCILSLINLISIINNIQLEYLDFTQRNKVRNKLLEKQIMKDKETNYLLFSQYIEDDDLINTNQLLISYKDEPKKYSNIPYNRNAILHGYSKKFGTEANCLRWFSVLFNTLEISEKFNKIENQANNC